MVSVWLLLYYAGDFGMLQISSHKGTFVSLPWKKLQQPQWDNSDLHQWYNWCNSLPSFCPYATQHHIHLRHSQEFSTGRRALAFPLALLIHGMTKALYDAFPIMLYNAFPSAHQHYKWDVSCWKVKLRITIYSGLIFRWGISDISGFYRLWQEFLGWWAVV